MGALRAPGGARASPGALAKAKPKKHTAAELAAKPSGGKGASPQGGGYAAKAAAANAAAKPAGRAPKKPSKGGGGPSASRAGGGQAAKRAEEKEQRLLDSFPTARPSISGGEELEQERG